jgi:hypothetical protein
MAAEDRRLRLSGYEVYRFGAAEFQQPDGSDRAAADVAALVVDFFNALFQRHGLTPVRISAVRDHEVQ